MGLEQGSHEELIIVQTRVGNMGLKGFPPSGGGLANTNNFYSPSINPQARGGSSKRQNFNAIYVGFYISKLGVIGRGKESGSLCTGIK